MEIVEKKKRRYRAASTAGAMSPWCYLSPIEPDKGNPEAMNTFNNSVSTDIGVSIGEDYDSPYIQERKELIKALKKYYPNFRGIIKGKEVDNYRLSKMIHRLKQQSKYKGTGDIRRKESPAYINDPKYNFDDLDREGEYEVESLKHDLVQALDEVAEMMGVSNDSSSNNLEETLRKLDSYNFKNNLPNYDFEYLYEGMKDNLSSEDRKKINDAAMKNDSETILKVLMDEDEKPEASLKEEIEDIENVIIRVYRGPSYDKLTAVYCSVDEVELNIKALKDKYQSWRGDEEITIDVEAENGNILQTYKSYPRTWEQDNFIF